MSIPQSTTRKVIEAMEAEALALDLADVVVLFEGTPFDALDQGVLQHGQKIIAIGMIREGSGVRTGARNRAASTLNIGVDLLTALDGREHYRDYVLDIIDRAEALAAGLEVWGASGIRTDAGLTTNDITSMEIGDVDVLLDPEGHFLARQIPVRVTLNRIT